MTHLVVLKDWTIEIKLSEDGESVTILASETHGSHFKKIFNKHKKRSSSLKLRRILSKESISRDSLTPRLGSDSGEDKEEKRDRKEKRREAKRVASDETLKESTARRATEGSRREDLTIVKNPLIVPDSEPLPRRRTFVPPLPLRELGATDKKIILSATRFETQYHNSQYNEDSHFYRLPQEVQILIFSFLTPSQLSVAQKVCTYFRLLAKDDIIWKGIFLSHFGGPKKRGRTWRQESMNVLERVGRHTRKHHAELLLWGARHGHTKFVENILQKSTVDINSVKRGNSAASPLHLASLEGHLKMVKLLLAHNANVNARTAYGRTPLERAAKSGHMKIVELLLDHEADVNAATCGGETPLLVAASGNHKEVVKILLAHGADVNATSQLGFTALRIATLQGYTEIVNLLSSQANNGPQSTPRSAALLTNGISAHPT